MGRFVIEQVLVNEEHGGAWFWAPYHGAQIDLLLRGGGRLLGVELKEVVHCVSPRLSVASWRT
jgi:hypothetical protein